jgi:hypothetical protein
MIKFLNLCLIFQTLFFNHCVNEVLSISSTSPVPYVTWEKTNGTNYDHSIYVGVGNEVVVHWKISNGKIYLAAGVEASGWLALGISESGGMPGSDIFLFESATGKLTDHYAQAYAKPTLDDCQNWNLTSSLKTSGFVLFEAFRDLDTGDTQDRAIKDDSNLGSAPHKLIAAWGDQEQMGYHANNRAKSEIRFFPSNSSWNKANDDIHEVYLQVKNYKIPEDETTYEDFFFSLNEIDPNGVLSGGASVHLINTAYIPDDESFSKVHHILLYGYTEEIPTQSSGLHLFTIWAAGSFEFFTPENVGILFGKNGIKSILMQVHYNNPNGISNVFDNSKFKLKFTTKLREHNGSFFQVGDPTVKLAGKGVGPGWSNWKFDCPGSCTMKHFPDKVTVAKTVLHMHQAGKKIISEHKREGKVLNQATVDYFDFNQVGALSIVHKPFQLKKGDSFTVNCYYHDNSNLKKFGLGSSDEMCISYYFYYPSVEINGFYQGCGLGYLFDTQCKVDYTSNTFSSESDIGRIFGRPPNVCISDLPEEKSPTKSPTQSTSNTILYSFLATSVIGVTVSFNILLFMIF